MPDTALGSMEKVWSEGPVLVPPAQVNPVGEEGTGHRGCQRHILTSGRGGHKGWQLQTQAPYGDSAEPLKGTTVSCQDQGILDLHP